MSGIFSEKAPNCGDKISVTIHGATYAFATNNYCCEGANGKTYLLKGCPCGWSWSGEDEDVCDLYRIDVWAECRDNVYDFLIKVWFREWNMRWYFLSEGVSKFDVFMQKPILFPPGGVLACMPFTVCNLSSATATLEWGDTTSS